MLNQPSDSGTNLALTRKYDHLSREGMLHLLTKRDAQARLGLVWERDEIDRDRALNSDFVTLEVDQALSVGDGPWKNLVIEGDNFDALRWLRMTMQGRIRMIYIDPPYNSGKQDFVYNDRFIEKADRYRHSKWLEWLSRRLELARDLLTKDGLLFVSIDDIEFARIRLLLDGIFGENAFMATLIWETDGNMDNQAKFKISHEYILVYARDPESVPAPPVTDPNRRDNTKLDLGVIQNTIVKNGPRNPVSEILLPAGFPASFDEGIILARNGVWPEYDSDVHIKEGKVVSPVKARSGWANKNLCERFIATGFEPVFDTKQQITRFVLSATGAIENIKIRPQEQSHVTSVIRNVGSVQSNRSFLLETTSSH